MGLVCWSCGVTLRGWHRESVCFLCSIGFDSGTGADIVIVVDAAPLGDGAATNLSGSGGAAGLSKDSKVLMDFLTKLEAKFYTKFADCASKINSTLLTLEQKLSYDLCATEQRIESGLHAKTVSMVSDLCSGLTADSSTRFSKLEQAIKVNCYHV